MTTGEVKAPRKHVMVVKRIVKKKPTVLRCAIFAGRRNWFGKILRRGKR